MAGTRSRQERLALAFLSVGALTGGFASIFVKLCRYPASAVASLRMLLAGLVLLPFCWKAVRAVFAGRGWRGLALIAVPGLLLAAHFQCWVWGLRYTSVANATFIVSLSPVFFALFERFAGGRRISSYTLIALALALAGALWLFFTGRGRLGQLGDALCLAAILFFVGYLLASRRAAEGIPHLAFAHLIYFWGGLLSLPLALIGRDPTAGSLADTGSLLALLGLVFLPTLVGHTSANYGVRHLSPVTVSFFFLAEPVLASAAALVILGEPLRPRELPAYGLFLAASLVYLISAARRKAG